MKQYIISIDEKSQNGKTAIKKINDLVFEKDVVILAINNMDPIIDLNHNPGKDIELIYPWFDKKYLFHEMSDKELFEILNTEIDKISLSVRLYNTLNGAGIITIGDIAKFNIKEILNIKHFGKKTMMELKDVLEKCNISLFQNYPYFQE